MSLITFLIKAAFQSNSSKKKNVQTAPPSRFDFLREHFPELYKLCREAETATNPQDRKEKGIQVKVLIFNELILIPHEKSFLYDRDIKYTGSPYLAEKLDNFESIYQVRNEMSDKKKFLDDLFSITWPFFCMRQKTFFKIKESRFYFLKKDHPKLFELCREAEVSLDPKTVERKCFAASWYMLYHLTGEDFNFYRGLDDLPSINREKGGEVCYTISHFIEKLQNAEIIFKRSIPQYVDLLYNASIAFIEF